MPKTFEERFSDAASAAGKVVDEVLSFRRKKPKEYDPVVNATKDEGNGPTFGSRGLELYEEVEYTDDRTGKKKKKMVVADMLKIAKKLNRKGVSSSLSTSNSMALWKPGASTRIPAQNAMENYTGLNFASISALADEVSAIVWELYQIDSKGEHKQLLEHDLLDLLEAPNPEVTGPDLKFRIIAHLELTGNCYLVMRKMNGKPISSEDEKPAMLTTMNPGNVIVEIDKSTDIDRITGYTLRKNAVEYHYERYQVLHLKRPNPNSEIEGVGTTQCIAEWIDVHNDGMEFNRQFFLHGSYLTAAIETEATDEDQIDSMRESFMEQHAGVQNSNKILMLMKGMKLTQTLQPKDMAFDKLIETTSNLIHAGTRVSATILGTAEADTNRATAETADYVFAKRLVKPRMQMICSQMNEYLTSRYGDGLYLSFTDPTPEDRSFRVQEMTAMENVMTINERREKYAGLGPIPGGDQIYVATTMAPIDASGALKPAQQPDDEKKPGEAKPDDHNDDESDEEPKEPTKGIPVPRAKFASMVIHPSKARFSHNRNIRKEAAKALADRIGDMIKEIHNEKRWNMDFKQYAVIAKEADDRQQDARKKLEAKAIEYLDDQENEVVGNLAKVLKAVDPKVLFDTKQSVQLVIDFATPILTELATLQGKEASTAINGVGVDVMENPEYQQAVERSIELLGNKYTETSLDDLKTTIESSLKEGDGILELTKKVRTYYDAAKQNRAPMLARTESFRISNSATKQAWKQVGVQKMKWFTSPLDNVCAFCQELNGKEIGIDTNFFNQGDTYTLDTGESMQIDYDDVGSPPLHPNCGCYLQPVYDPNAPLT
jgi:HK97 family phage portal protein